MLIGLKEIASLLNRDVSTIRRWLKSPGAEDIPIKKVGGRYEADADKLTEWRIKKILSKAD